MPSFRSGRVAAVLAQRPGLQRVEVVLDGDRETCRALNYPELSGAVAVGDDVVCNTTAVELGLGTGGWHVVHWNLSRREFRHDSGGHVMKLRYSSLQTDVLAAEEEGSRLRPALVGARSLDGFPVAVAGLHSLLAAVAAGFAAAAPDRRLAYVMTDGAALPLALSDLVHALRSAGLLAVTATCGQAFGGELETVTGAAALVATRAAGADAAVCAMGPGVVGTDTPLGFSALEVAGLLDTVRALGGRAVAVPRVSFADARDRHSGLSHHTATALQLARPGPDLEVVVPAIGGGEEAEIRETLTALGCGHTILGVDPGNALGRLGEADVHPKSMGRGLGDDPVFWAAGAAAGVRLGQLAAGP